MTQETNQTTNSDRHESETPRGGDAADHQDDLGGHDYETKTVRVHNPERGVYDYLMLTRFDGEGSLLGKEGWRGEYIWYSIVSRNKQANVSGADPFSLARRYPSDAFPESPTSRLMKDIDMDRIDFDELRDGHRLTPEEIDQLAGRSDTEAET